MFLARCKINICLAIYCSLSKVKIQTLLLGSMKKKCKKGLLSGLSLQYYGITYPLKNKTRMTTFIQIKIQKYDQ